MKISLIQPRKWQELVAFLQQRTVPKRTGFPTSSGMQEEVLGSDGYSGGPSDGGSGGFGFGSGGGGDNEGSSMMSKSMPSTRSTTVRVGAANAARGPVQIVNGPNGRRIRTRNTNNDNPNQY